MFRGLLLAQSGREGIERALAQLPALILLDMHLPDTIGEEVLRRLRRSELTGDIPVVAVSADVTGGRVNRMLLSGAADYITKPIVVADVLDVLDGWCLAAV